MNEITQVQIYLQEKMQKLRRKTEKYKELILQPPVYKICIGLGFFINTEIN